MAAFVVTSHSRSPGNPGRLGGLGGLDWWAAEDDIIAMIGAGHVFWIPLGGEEVEVIVATRGMNERYLTTRDDQYSSEPRTLLMLPMWEETGFPQRQ